MSGSILGTCRVWRGRSCNGNGIDSRGTIRDSDHRCIAKSADVDSRNVANRVYHQRGTWGRYSNTLDHVGLAPCSFQWRKRLELLLPVLAIAPIARGLVSPRMVEYARVFNFKPDTIIEISAKLAAFSISVGVAATTGSYWAVAAATISGPLVSTFISYCIVPIRPRLTFSQWSYFQISSGGIFSVNCVWL